MNKSLLAVMVLLAAATMASAGKKKASLVVVSTENTSTVTVTDSAILFIDALTVKGKAAGKSSGVCTFLPDKKKSSHCSVVHVLKKGSIALTIPFSTAAPSKYTGVITGGTGAYSGAKGSVTVDTPKAGQFTYYYYFD